MDMDNFVEIYVINSELKEFAEPEEATCPASQLKQNIQQEL